MISLVAELFWRQISSIDWRKSPVNRPNSPLNQPHQLQAGPAFTARLNNLTTRDLLEMLKEIGSALPELWNQGLLSWSQKKSLFRCLVEKVVLKRDNDRVTMRIVWRGGDVTEQIVPITVGRFEQLADAQQIEELILSMAQAGHTDKQIAAHLTEAGHRSPRSSTLLPSTVTRIRKEHGIRHQEKLCQPHRVPGYLRPHQLAKLLHIKPHWIYDRIRNGMIQVEKNAEYRSYLFPDDPSTLTQFQQFIHGKVATLAF